MLFVESSRFTRDFATQASEEDLRQIQVALLRDPERGSLIPGTGGLRKLRWGSPRQQRGKRGGLRLLYLHLREAECLHLLHCFAKNEKEDLTPEEKRTLRRLVEQLTQEARRPGRRRGNSMARPLFQALRGSLEEAIAFHRGKATLRTHAWHMEPAPKFAARDIRRLRSRLRISQGVLAAALNVSMATVQSWEQGRRRPEGAALRLLEILTKHPQSLLRATRGRTAA